LHYCRVKRTSEEFRKLKRISKRIAECQEASRGDDQKDHGDASQYGSKFINVVEKGRGEMYIFLNVTDAGLPVYE